MAAFLGFIAQCTPLVSGEHKFLPYRGYVAGCTPQEQWDNIPLYGKLQIFVLVGMLESYGEGASQPDGYVHYMRGGKPGYFPPFGGPVPDLVFGRAGITRASAETNAKRLNVEVNNGRLAMIGLFGFLAEANCPGAVPGLTGLIKPYGGPKIMSPDWLYNTWECMVPSTDACWFADGPAAAAPAVVKAAATAAAPAVEAASGAFEAAASAL